MAACYSARCSGWLLLLALILPASADAFDYHVDPVLGDDLTGDGSIALPWKTLGQALEQASCPAVVWLAPGIYDAASGERFPIGALWASTCFDFTIRGDAAGGTLFRTGGQSGFKLIGFEGHATFRLERLTIESAASISPGTAGIDASQASHVSVSDCRISGFCAGLLVSGPPMNGIGHTGSQWVTCERNLLSGNERGVDIFAAPSPWGGMGELRFDLVNNVIRDNEIGVKLGFDCPAPCGLSFVPWLAHNTLVSQGSSAVVGCAFPFDGNVVAGNGGYGVDDGCVGTANVFWDNALGDLRSGPLPPGNLHADPRFVDPTAADYHLLAGSPAIDLVLDDAQVRDDFEGNLRPLDGDGDGIDVSDAGAYERTGPRTRLDLYRFDLSALDPPTPDRAQAFPLDASNSGAILAAADFVSGAAADAPAAAPLSLYGLAPAPARRLLLVKIWSGSVRGYLR